MIHKNLSTTVFLLSVLILFATGASAQENNSNFATQTVDRKIESLLLIEQLNDVAHVDIVRLAGPPPAYRKVTGTAFKDSLLDNPLKFYSYVFIPKSTKQNKKYPLLVFPHGGVHSNFTSGSVHILREMLAQGYIVIAPDYRGSTGYGKTYTHLDDVEKRLDSVHDVECLVHHLIDSGIADPARIAVMGAS